MILLLSFDMRSLPRGLQRFARFMKMSSFVLAMTPRKPTPIFAPLESSKAMASHASVKLCAVKLAANSGKQQTGSALSAQRFGIDPCGRRFSEHATESEQEPPLTQEPSIVGSRPQKRFPEQPISRGTLAEEYSPLHRSSLHPRAPWATDRHVKSWVDG